MGAQRRQSRDATSCRLPMDAVVDLARLESGHTPSRRVLEYWNGDIPWIGIHRRQNTTDAESIRLVNRLRKLASEIPRLDCCRLTQCVSSRTASVGYVVTAAVPMATSQDFVNWVCGPGLVVRYLHYLLMAEQDSIRRFAHGTTHQTVSFPEAKAFWVCIPPLSEQRAIAEVLGGLDDKIEVNDRTRCSGVDLLGPSSVNSALLLSLRLPRVTRFQSVGVLIALILSWCSGDRKQTSGRSLRLFGRSSEPWCRECPGPGPL